MNSKIARIKEDLTLEQLRKKLKDDYSVGISPCTLVSIEKGNFDNVNLGKLKAIASALNSTVQELFLSNEN